MALKKYRMIPINDGFARKTGVSGFYGKIVNIDTIDAYKKILPGSIDKCGVKLTKGVAETLIDQFLLDCNDEFKETGDNIKIGDVMMLKIATKGGLKAAKTDRITKEDLRMVAQALQGRQTFAFDIQNEVDGIIIRTYTATGVTQGRDVDTFTAGENVRINGKNLLLLEGDFVELFVGETSLGLCTVVESDTDHIIVTPPAMAGAMSAGTQVDFAIASRGGDPNEARQVTKQKATLAAYDGTVPLIMAFNQGDLEEGTFHCNADEWVTLKGAGFRSLNIQSLKVGHRSGNTYDKQINATEVSIVDDNTMRFKLPTNTSTMTDEELREADLSVTLYTQSAISAAYTLTYVG